LWLNVGLSDCEIQGAAVKFTLILVFRERGYVFYVFWVSGFREQLVSGHSVFIIAQCTLVQSYVSDWTVYKLQQRIICTFADVLTADTS